MDRIGRKPVLRNLLNDKDPIPLLEMKAPHLTAESASPATAPTSRRVCGAGCGQLGYDSGLGTSIFMLATGEVRALVPFGCVGTKRLHGLV